MHRMLPPPVGPAFAAGCTFRVSLGRHADAAHPQTAPDGQGSRRPEGIVNRSPTAGIHRCVYPSSLPFATHDGAASASPPAPGFLPVATQKMRPAACSVVIITNPIRLAMRATPERVFKVSKLTGFQGTGSCGRPK